LAYTELVSRRVIEHTTASPVVLHLDELRVNALSLCELTAEHGRQWRRLHHACCTQQCDCRGKPAAGSPTDIHVLSPTTLLVTPSCRQSLPVKGSGYTGLRGSAIPSRVVCANYLT
jgi:hypothetical protein